MENEKIQLNPDKSAQYDKQFARINRKFGLDQSDNNIGMLSGQVNRDNLDSKGSASRYLDSVLVALKPGDVFKSVDGTKIASYGKGANLGTIYSYVVAKDGSLWWLIDKTGPFANRFVKHEPGKFDKIILENTSSGLAIEKRNIEMKASQVTALDKIADAGSSLVSGVANTVKGIGKNFGYIIAAVVIVALIALTIKLQK